MKSILEQLYDGDVCPFEDNLLANRECRQLDDQFSENWKAFFKSIPAESKGLFFEMENDMNHIQYLHLRAAFVKGFQLGVQILLESISSK